MGHNYQAVGWNRQKKRYDTTLVAGVVLYLAAFLGIGFALHPDATAETMLIRAFGTGAFLLLHVILCIGPLARLDRRFLPLLYNRRHLGVTMFLLALGHGLVALVQFHAFGDVNPLVSLFASNPRWTSIAQFPFQPLGFAALGILFLMAATSHDFWLANLTAPVWKALHMLVYVVYGLLVMHVTLGALQAETSPLYLVVVATGVFVVSTLHLIAARRERVLDEPLSARLELDGLVDACGVDDIPEKRAKIVTLAGERVAVFRYDGKVSAVSNVCQHQNGPLGEGRIADGCITCPWHGYQYEPDCGKSPAPFTETIPTFRVRVTDGRVLVDPRPLPAGTRVEPAVIADGAAEEPDDGDFFVGYLPTMPARLASWVRPRVAALVAVAAVLAVALVAAQRPFSKSVWEYGNEREFEGWLQDIPYPTLLVERPDGTASRWLLVALGKHGAQDEVAGLDGAYVRLTGTLVYREDRTMIEITPGTVVRDDSARRLPMADGLLGPGPEDLGTHTLVGEIVDSKCFLGVMKPGELKPHRACATRCISGGVPPVLLVRGSDGTATYFVLTSSDGAAVNGQVLDKIAEPLEITGRVLRYDDLLVLRSDPDTYRRAGPASDGASR